MSRSVLALVVKAVVIMLALAVLLPAIAGACPNCKDASSDADTPGGSANLGRGFFWSILLMIAAPFTAVGGVAAVILRKRRRQSGARA